MALFLFKRLARLFPGLGEKLVQAGLLETPEAYVRKSFFVAFYMTTFVSFVLAILFIRFNTLAGALVIIVPAMFIFLFVNFVKRPDIIIKKKQKEFDREIVFAGKFLVIELQSGVPVYNAMISVSKNYPAIGKFFREIVNRIDIGTPIEEAINESIELTPSQNFRKILWQIYNSLKTGSDLSKALDITIDQITQEQVIQVKEYGRKLNPLVMFYMAVAVIFPSIGVIMVIVFSSFFSVNINLIVLLAVTAFVTFMQFIFLTIMRKQRPAVGL